MPSFVRHEEKKEVGTALLRRHHPYCEPDLGLRGLHPQVRPVKFVAAHEATSPRLHARVDLLQRGERLICQEIRHCARARGCGCG